MKTEKSFYSDSKKVLVVEDDLALKPIISKILKLIDPKIELDWKTNVEVAKQVLNENDYALIIADFALQGKLTGIDLWKFCNDYYTKIPFIIISGMPIPTFLAMMGSEICPPILQKPFYLGEAQQVLKHFLEGKQEGENYV